MKTLLAATVLFGTLARRESAAFREVAERIPLGRDNRMKSE